uniref:non-specific serine/threonine protein kinase n=1 Tax=Xenopus tropicalis TaxID=8364 RepID=A0A803JG56_XENTR
MFSRFRKRFIKIFKSNNRNVIDNKKGETALTQEKDVGAQKYSGETAKSGRLNKLGTRIITIFGFRARDSHNIMAALSCPQELVLQPVLEQLVPEPIAQEPLPREMSASTCLNIKAASEELKPTKENLRNVLVMEKIRVRENEMDKLAQKERNNRELRHVHLRETIRNQEKETQEQIRRQTEQRSKEKERWMSLEKEAEEENKREIIKRKERNMLLNDELKAQREERLKEKERSISLEKGALKENNGVIMKNKQKNLLSNMETEKQKKIKKKEEERRMKEKAKKKMTSPYCKVVERLDQVFNMKEPDSRMVQKAPPRIEDFQLQSILGKGSFGKVYKAQHRETGETIALKTLALCEMNDKSTFTCLALEQRTLRLVSERQCPFLTSLVCSFQTEHYMCLGMEYAEGGALISYLVKGGLPLERVRFYSACIVLGLQFLHEHNIAHRDLKPANVLVCSDGYAKLADFGLCREGMAFHNICVYRCGTLPYMAPELLRSHYTRSVDWWALGVVMYNLLTGCAPFHGANVKELLTDIMDKELEFPID